MLNKIACSIYRENNNKSQNIPCCSKKTDEPNKGYTALNLFYPRNYYANKISFGALPNVHYPKEDIEKIKILLKNYKYEKDFDKILAPSNRFSVKKAKNSVKLENFSFLSSNDPEIKGVCEELTFDLFKKLKKEFDAKYHFAVVSGKSPQFFNKKNSDHDYIIGFPRKNAYDFIFGLNLSRESRISAKDEKGVPSQVLIIDPTFKICGVNKGYTIKALNYDSDSNPSFSKEDLNVRFDNNDLYGSYKAFPLGYWNDLIGNSAGKPKYIDNIKQNPLQNPLLYQKFYKDDQGKIRFALAMQANSNSAVENVKFWRNLFYELPPNNKFKQFLEILDKNINNKEIPK